MIYEEKLPLQAVSGCELCLTRMNHWKLSDELRSQQPPRGHEDRLVGSREEAVGPREGVRHGD